MPPRLDQQALSRVDQQDRQVGGGRAGRHVARVLFVPRRVGDDEAPVRRVQETIGDVDRNALLALCLQPVHEKGEVHRVACGAVALAVPFQRIQLVGRNRTRVVQQPADQRGLAVVHAAAGEHAQQAARLFRHQKYPSRFFFSIADASSRSISRPWRSDVRAPSVSVSTSSSVAASDRTAAVSG